MDEQRQILLVDDRQDSRIALARLIEKLGVELRVAESYSIASGFIKERAADFILLRIDLEGDKGKALLREHSDTVSAVLAEPSQEALVIDALKQGANDYLFEPFTEGDLHSMLFHLNGIFSRRRNKIFHSDDVRNFRMSMVLETDSRVVTPCVELASSLLSGFVDEKTCMQIGLGLHEILWNAYEHGNLGIRSDEKLQLCESGGLEAELEKRSIEARKRGLTIGFEVEMDRGVFCCRVEDQGRGFDWKSTKERSDNPEPEDLLKPHGRGLGLVGRTFDSVSYNESGNKVTVTKLLNS